MKTGNRRRRKLNRLAKARTLRARCLGYQLRLLLGDGWSEKHA